MTLLGLPNDVVERIASILLRLREGGEKYGESCCDRRAMEKAFRAVLSLSMTCKELRRLLRPTAMHREARARRDTIIWPSLRGVEVRRGHGRSRRALCDAQRQEEKQNKEDKHQQNMEDKHKRNMEDKHKQHHGSGPRVGAQTRAHRARGTKAPESQQAGRRIGREASQKKKSRSGRRRASSKRQAARSGLRQGKKKKRKRG